MLKRRNVLLPTWQGWLVLAILATLSAGALPRCASRVIPRARPSGAKVIVVGGWEADYVLKATLDWAALNQGSVIVVTGGKIDKGASLVPERDFAEFGVRRLKALGLNFSAYRSAGSELANTERVATAALGFRSFWFKAENKMPDRIDVVTDEWSGRSTQLYYKAALPNNVIVGVVPASDPATRQEKWWRGSKGVRKAIQEMLACIYVQFFISSPGEASVAG